MEIRGAKRAFSPQIIRKQRKQGENIKKKFDLLPGYVFIYSEERLTDYRFFFGIDGVIRRVGKTEEGYELAGPDLDFAMKLLDLLNAGQPTVRDLPDYPQFMILTRGDELVPLTPETDYAMCVSPEKGDTFFARLGKVLADLRTVFNRLFQLLKEALHK